MHLRQGEHILKVYRHHPTPFVFNVLKCVAVIFPFFFMLFLIQNSISTSTFAIAQVVLFIAFFLLVAYISLIYWLDKFVVTDQRVIYINWKYLTLRTESEAKLEDIQDVRTSERGFLAYFRAFDYGMLRLDTASSSVILEFDNAPDPEGMRQFIYHLRHQ